MAKIQSTMFNAMRGSIAGTTFLTTPAGQIIARARTNPVNPQTGRQTGIRTKFSWSVANWEAMSQVNRDLWQDYADSLGTGKSGREVFIANFTFMQWCGSLPGETVTPTADPPTDPGALLLANVVATTPLNPGTRIGVLVDNGNAFTINAVADVSRQFSPARERFQGPFSSSSAFATEIAGPGTETIEFSGLVEDAVYFVRIRAVTVIDYAIISAPFIVRCIAETIV